LWSLAIFIACLVAMTASMPKALIEIATIIVLLCGPAAGLTLAWIVSWPDERTSQVHVARPKRRSWAGWTLAFVIVFLILFYFYPFCFVLALTL
jgi:hypothetical protein